LGGWKGEEEEFLQRSMNFRASEWAQIPPEFLRPMKNDAVIGYLRGAIFGPSFVT
jgi:hypothetical protein